MPPSSGTSVRAPVPRTRLSAWNRSPATSTVCSSITVAVALRMYSIPSCSLLCQFMNAWAALRPLRNSSTTSRMDARFSSKSGNHRLPDSQPGQVELAGRLREQVVGHARLVWARTAEERPPVHGQLAPASGTQVRGAEPASRTAADEDGVERTSIATIDVVDRLTDLPDLGAVDDRTPLR